MLMSNARTQHPESAPVVLKCPKCGRTVATIPAAEAWCLPCGAKMQRVKGKARP